MTYVEKLKDPRWQKKRLEIMNRDGFHCRMCGDGKSTLHVHHNIYINGRDPWDYDNDNLVTLCECCHETESTEMESVCSDLISICKYRGLMSGDIHELANAILNMEKIDIWYSQLRALGRFLSNREKVIKMCDNEWGMIIKEYKESKK